MPIRSSTVSGVISLVFIGLAVIIGVGAVGSVLGAGANTAVPSTESADADPSTTASSDASAADTSHVPSDPEAGPERRSQLRMQSARHEDRPSAIDKATSSPTDGDSGPSANASIVRPAETAHGATPKDLEGLF